MATQPSGRRRLPSEAQRPDVMFKGLDRLTVPFRERFAQPEHHSEGDCHLELGEELEIDPWHIFT